MTLAAQFGYHDTERAKPRETRHLCSRAGNSPRQRAASMGHARICGSGLAGMRVSKVEEEQLEKVLSGDKRSLNAFVDAMTPIIQARVARCLLRGSARDLSRDVEDHTQDVFMHLFADDARALRQWREEGGLSLANFVGLIAERRTISALRSGKRNPWREDTPLEAHHDQGRADSGPAEEVARLDAIAALFELLRQRLSPLGWQLFQLLYVQEKSVNEVRAATGLRADAVYAWRSRLRRTARECRVTLDSGEVIAMRRE